jgi:hypothetical protein
VQKDKRRWGRISIDLAEPTGNRALIHRKVLLKLPNSYWTPAVFLGFSGVLTDKSRCSDLPKKPQL